MVCYLLLPISGKFIKNLPLSFDYLRSYGNSFVTLGQTEFFRWKLNLIFACNYGVRDRFDVVLTSLAFFCDELLSSS